MSARPRGFSLVEVMVASAMIFIIFAGATYAAVQLHRRGNFEESVADLQDVARGSRELIAPRIERAGAGLSNLSVTVGKDASGNADVRNSFSVRTGVVVPPPAYPSLTSDAIDLYWTESASTMVPVSPCGVVASTRNADDICVGRLPNGTLALNPNDYILVANSNPSITASCLFKVQSIPLGGPGLPGRIRVTGPGMANDSALDAYSPCTTANATAAFWKSPELTVMRMGGASFQLDWTTGNPRLMYDPDGWWGGVAAQPVADNVDRMQIRVGLVSLDLLNPPPPLPPTAPLAPPPVIWFPDPTAVPPRPPLDQCTVANPACAIGAASGVNSDINFPDKFDAVDLQIANVLQGPAITPDMLLRARLMRRARLVELQLTIRAARPDPAQVQMTGVVYNLDTSGNPLDGRARRQYDMRVSLRNYGYAGM